MTSRADLIAQAVLSQFKRLPAKRKPCIRPNGVREWVPLSGIVAEKNGQITCLAMATGMKCLPVSKLADSNGVGIHDWHAEVLAIRTFNRFLLDECRRVAKEEWQSDIIEDQSNLQLGIHEGQGYSYPFTIRSDVRLHMYCSEAPCGDASMELTMAAQEDAAPWDSPHPSTNGLDELLPGRAHFDLLGIVRRKPARGDAPVSLSKSCSDKIALKQCTSLLSSVVAMFVDPTNAYLSTLIIPTSQYSSSGCRRAFSAEGRMSPCQGKQWPGGYAFKPFQVETTDAEFAFSRRSAQVHETQMTPSNLATAWNACGLEESIIGGVLAGRKAFDKRGASLSSRRQMWSAARDLVSRGTHPRTWEDAILQETYQQVKDSAMLASRRMVKAEVRATALPGWTQNKGDSDFTLNSPARTT